MTEALGKVELPCNSMPALPLTSRGAKNVETKYFKIECGALAQIFGLK